MCIALLLCDGLRVKRLLLLNLAYGITTHLGLGCVFLITLDALWVLLMSYLVHVLTYFCTWGLFGHL